MQTMLFDMFPYLRNDAVLR